MSQRMTALELLRELERLGFEPEVLLTGRLTFRGPRGVLTDALRERIAEMRDEMAAIVRRDASYPVPTAAAGPPPSPATNEELAGILEGTAAARLTHGTTFEDELENAAGDLFVHRGDARTDGKVIGYGTVTLIEGSLRTTGDVVPVSDGGGATSWFVVGGDLECRHLTVPERVQLLVGGNIRATGLASIATQDSMARIGGGLRASTVVSGLSGGAFSVGGAFEADVVVGEVERLDGEPLVLPEMRAEASLDARALHEGQVQGEVLVALVACGLSPFAAS